VSPAPIVASDEIVTSMINATDAASAS